MPYTLDVLKDLIYKYNAEIFLIHWDIKKRHPYNFDSKIFYKCVPISELNFDNEIKSLKEFKPDLVYCSGIMEKQYLKIIKLLKCRDKTVMGCDNQWEGSIKNHLQSFFSFLLYKPFFKYSWVSGFQQYEFCRRLGFKKDSIIFNLYSSPSSFTVNSFSENNKVQKKLLFVGRDAKVKNVDFLVNVFLSFCDNELNGWTLYLVGSETFKKYEIEDRIVVLPFMDSDSLSNFAHDFDAFILPSIHEPWGVVVHEFCYKGLILLLSDNVGAKDFFLIEGYNGFSFDPLISKSLKMCLSELFSYDELKLKEMKNNSTNLALRINSSITSSSFVSLIYKIRKNEKST
jgi:glycosyltransferase involved in cell wall biosynthesis